MYSNLSLSGLDKSSITSIDDVKSIIHLYSSLIIKDELSKL